MSNRAILFIESPETTPTQLAGTIRQLDKEKISSEICSLTRGLIRLKEKKFQLAVIKVNRADDEVIDIMRAVHNAQKGISVLVVSMNVTERNAVRVLRQGAHAYVQHESVSTELMNAVNSVLRGQRYIS